MSKFIIGSFLILGWGFYEISGGADFVPETVVAAQTQHLVEKPKAIPFAKPIITRTPVVEVPTPEPEPEVSQVAYEIAPLSPIDEATPMDLRMVSGARVNMRSGPGTQHDVLDTLTRGTQAEVVEINSEGWARIRVTDSYQIGWMLERLLAEI